jgi:photosystem II stability/assembly factor-like uncharacterized protein
LYKSQEKTYSMKVRLGAWLIVLALMICACSQTTTQAPQSGEQPPTPYPDTPSPARIEAPLVESPAIITLHMFNELNGWAVTDVAIARTNDGGLTWYNVSPPDMTETGYSVGTFFLDNDHAWVQKPDPEQYPNSGTLYRTTDGGRTWENFVVPYSGGDLSFVDSENGWVLADLGVGAGSNAVAMFQTTDGGASWEKTYTNDPNEADASDSLPLGGIKSDLVPLDMNQAWVTGVTYAPGEVYLYRTVNQGKSWKHMSLPLPPGAENFELAIDKDQMKFVSPIDGYLAMRMSGDATQTAVYVTHDAGSTWNLTPTVLDGAGTSSFLTRQEAVIFNGEQFQVTRDEAQTWSAVVPDISFEETFAGMEFVNLMSGWVITMDPSTSHRSLYRTQDGGSTWLPVVP